MKRNSKFLDQKGREVSSRVGAGSSSRISRRAANANAQSGLLLDGLEPRVLLTSISIGGISIPIPGLPNLPSLTSFPIDNLPIGLNTLSSLTNPNSNDYWWLNNTGQTLDDAVEGPATGKAGADIDATDAWNITTGSPNVVVAVLDTGIDLSNADLNSVLWTNPGNLKGDPETGDLHGWNFLNNSSDVQDNFVHGTAVAAAIHSVAPNVTILPVEIGTSAGASAQDVIEGINYLIALKKAGVNIVAINASFITYDAPTQAELSAISNAGNNGMLYAAAAGNAGLNFDSLIPSVPSIFQSYVQKYISQLLPSNLIYVAATNDKDQLASFSDYGQDIVAVGAPGVDMTLAIPGGIYAPLSGTSFAAPMVSAIAALLKSRVPTATESQIKTAILNSGDLDPSLEGKTITGRRVNAYKALTYLIGNQPATGAVTTLNSTEIDGWAYDPNLGSKPASVEISVDGVNYPAVSADDADTAAPALAGDGDHGFSFDMPTLDYGKHAIKVFVIDEPSGDPKQIGSGTVIINQPPTGALESVAGNVLTGWAQDPDTPTQSIKVKILVDGKAWKTVTAGVERDDLTSTLGSPDHGYSVNLTGFKAGIHRVDVYAIDSLTGALTLIGTSEFSTNLPAEGDLETFTAASLIGWAFDPNAGTTAIRVQYQIDDFAPVTVTANGSRPDLIATLGSKNHGFDIALPQLTAGDHTVTISAIDPNTRELIQLGSQTFAVTDPVGDLLPTGTVQTLTNTSIAGTVSDADSTGPIEVRVDVDGKAGKPFLSTATDLDATTYAFSYTLPKLSAGPHRIDVYALDGTSLVPVLIASSLVNDTPATGAVESLSTTTATGWAYDPSAANGQALIRIDIDGLSGALVTASVSRPDLLGTVGAKNIGFKITLPQLAPGDHTVSVILIDPVTLVETVLAATTITTT